MKHATQFVMTLWCCAALAGCRRPTPVPPAGSQNPGSSGSFARELAEAKKAGLPVSPKELQAPVPPDAQNAAPLYTELTHLLKTRPLSQEDKAAETLAKRSMPSAAQSEQARLAVKNRADILQLVHQAAARPQCVFVRNWSVPNPAKIEFPEFAAMREGVRFLSAESLLWVVDKKPLEAVQNQALGFQMARHGSCEKTVISYLAGVALDAITLSGMKKILYLHGDDPKVADAVREAIEKGWTARSLAPPLRGEVAFQMGMIEFLRKVGPNGLDEASGSSLAHEAQPPNRKQSPQLDPKTWNSYLDANGVLILQRLRKLIAIANQPFPQANIAGQTSDTEFEQDKDPKHALAAILYIASSPLLAKRAQIQAIADTVRVSAAVLAWKARHGKFPQKLEEAITPVPVDPFDGKPLRYRQEGKGFVVYSVGKDGKFDGGTPDKRPDTWDVVFRYPMPPYYQAAAGQ